MLSLAGINDANIVTPSCFFPEGLALAAGIGLGAWIWPGVFLGQLWLALQGSIPLSAALVIAAANSLEVVIAVLLFRRLGLRSNLHRLRDLTGLLLLIMLVLQPFSASVGTLTLAFHDALPRGSDLSVAWQDWWIGNTLGQVLVTPLLLSALHERQALGRFLRHVLQALLLITPAAWLAFRLINGNGTSVMLVIFTPLLVLIAVELGLPGASAAGLGLTITAQTMTRLGKGPFVAFGAIQIIDLNTFVMGLSLTAEFLAVLMAERRRLEEKLRQYAFYDPLTQLPNRRLFQERLSQSRRSSEWSALILLDLDRFKPLNDTHGHEAGDQLLIEVARRLQRGLPDGDLAARLGGDEFAVILNNLGGDEQAAELRARAMARRLADRLGDPYDLGPIEHRCTASFGIRLYRGDGHEPHQLLRDADRAMYLAKQQASSSA